MTVSLLKPKGETFVHIAVALASAKGSLINAVDEARERYGTELVPAKVLKAAVASGGLNPSSDWGSELAQLYRDASSEFYGLIAATSVVGRLAGARRIPPRVRLIAPQIGAVGYWRAEGAAKAVTRMTLDAFALEPRTCASIIILTRELLASSDPRAESWVRADMLRALSAELDRALLDPANAGDSATPQAITYGATSIPGTASASEDIKDVTAAFEGDLANAIFITTPFGGAQICNADFPDAGARGGSIKGIPLLTSSHCPEGLLILVDASAVAVASGDTSLRASEAGALEMADVPAHGSTTPTGVQLVSLWETNSIALLCEQVINWSRLRDLGVAFVENATWATPSLVT